MTGRIVLQRGSYKLPRLLRPRVITGGPQRFQLSGFETQRADLAR
jgi:hypothetical protein